MDSITLDDIAGFLLGKKTVRIILFLGSKAGGFFENEKLYSQVKGFSTETFDSLEREEKFQTCYRMLEENFFERDRDSVLNQSLSTEQDSRLEDDYLAEMIKANIFDGIISTNIDPLLEDALKHEGAKESRDYHLLIYGKTPVMDLKHYQHDFVLKIFGDLESKYYKTAGDEFLVEQDEELRDFLEHMLNSAILMVGYDPVWDGPLDKAFFMKGGELIYVNETPLSPESFISRVIRRRKGKCLIGEEGEYKNFIQSLYAHLFERGRLSYEAIQKVSRQLQQIQDEITLLHNETNLLGNAVRDLENWLKFRGEGEKN